MKRLAIIATLALSQAAFAGELVLHLVSRHSDYNSDKVTQQFNEQTRQWETTTVRAYNNQNFGVGYITDEGWTFGAYRNSYYKTSVYVGRQFLWDTPLELFDRPVRAGAVVLAATGYPKRTIQPSAGLQLNVPILPMADVVIIGLPSIGDNDGVGHLAVAYRF